MKVANQSFYFSLRLLNNSSELEYTPIKYKFNSTNLNDTMTIFYRSDTLFSVYGLSLMTEKEKDKSTRCQFELRDNELEKNTFAMSPLHTLFTPKRFIIVDML